MADASECPFCGFKPTQGEYQLLLHLETYHAEGDSPFVESGRTSAVSHGNGGGEGDRTISMTVDDQPGAEHPPEDPASHDKSRRETRRQPVEEAARPSGSRSGPPHRSHKDSQHGTVVQAWKALFEGHSKSPRVRHRNKPREPRPSSRTSEDGSQAASTHDSTHDRNKTEPGAHPRPRARLGRSELGRFAHEKEMPEWLTSLLVNGDEARSDGIIPVLEQLLGQSHATEYAYLCQPRVQHVSKLKREGGFCGYRNIQMAISHLIGAGAARADLFGATYPNILQIQDLIENAWDMGFNPHGRVETGGIRGTRKYIGTPEAQALFCSLGIPCSVEAFKDGDLGRARELLLQAVEGYFEKGWDKTQASKVRATARPPIFLQQPGHSMTIVGFERQKDGQANILVFDPAARDSRAILQLVDSTFRLKPASADDVLQAYRRGTKHLRKHGEFETLYLTTRPDVHE